MAEFPEDARGSLHVDSLLDACRDGNLPRVEALVSDDPALVDLFGCLCDEGLRKAHAEDGWTALHVAAHYGQLGVMKLLMGVGANLNTLAKNSIACTPIGAAAAGHQLEAIKMLLEKGADVNIANSHGYTVLHYAAAEGDAELARLCLTHGADKTLKGKDGHTAADIAEQKGHTDIVNLLSD